MKLTGNNNVTLKNHQLVRKNHRQVKVIQIQSGGGQDFESDSSSSDSLIGAENDQIEVGDFGEDQTNLESPKLTDNSFSSCKADQPESTSAYEGKEERQTDIGKKKISQESDQSCGPPSKKFKFKILG